MNFVEDDQLEGVSVSCHHIPGGMIRCDCNWQGNFFCAVINADLCAEGIDESCIPLMEKFDCWSHNESRALDQVDGVDSNKRFSCAGGQYNASPAVGFVPRLQRFVLVIVGLSVILKLARQPFPSRNIVIDSSIFDPIQQSRVVVGFTASMLLDPLENRRQIFCLVWTSQHECTAIVRHTYRLFVLITFNHKVPQLIGNF